MTIDIELWDSAASGGVGRKLAHASVDLDLHAFEPFKAQSAAVELFGRESKVQPRTLQCAENSGTLNPEGSTIVTASPALVAVSVVSCVVTPNVSYFVNQCVHKHCILQICGR